MNLHSLNFAFSSKSNTKMPFPIHIKLSIYYYFSKIKSMLELLNGKSYYVLNVLKVARAKIV